MGRLFWKFFLFIWLAQMAGIVGVGAVFWFERQRADHSVANQPSDQERPADAAVKRGGPPPFGAGRPHGPPPDELHAGAPPPPGGHGRGGPLPVVPVLGALIASLFCALGLAWYFAKPIRHLRRAFDAGADGDLSVRIGASMGGRRDELADLGRDFDRMTERLGLLVEGQKRLLHDVSHEMRSPLARLQAAIGLARQQPARMDDSLERIQREGERMNQLVGELLTLSRLESGVIGNLETVDIAELLNDIVEDARFEGAVRRVAVDFAGDDLPEVRANVELLHRAIENVVRNALRFSPVAGTVRIEAGRTPGGALRLAIIDSGPGVPEADLDAIFTPFFRGDNPSAGAGYGLGLAIAKRVVDSLGGKICAKNLVSGGFVVEIELEPPV